MVGFTMSVPNSHPAGSDGVPHDRAHQDLDEPGTVIDIELVEQLSAALGPRLAAVQERMRQAGGDNVTLLPVSKAHPVEAIVAARRHGLDSFGENYAQELAMKHSTLAAMADVSDAPVIGDERAESTKPRFHFVGQLQRNKVRHIAGAVELWQSVDRIRVADEIAKRAPGARVLAQVNLADDPAKAGCNFDELAPLVERMHELGLRVEGLMGVGAAADELATAQGFQRLRSQVDVLGLTVCSMGMTADLEVAIREGSTLVRVGTAIFGPRK